jgi:hypothetical protein
MKMLACVVVALTMLSGCDGSGDNTGRQPTSPSGSGAASSSTTAGSPSGATTISDSPGTGASGTSTGPGGANAPNSSSGR